MAGRPSKAQQWLTEDGLSMLTHYKRNDLTDAEIAKKIGIGAATFNDWKRRYPTISEALKNGLEYAVKDAEEALLLKFKPYTYEEEKIEMWQIPTGEYGADGKPKMKVREQHVVKTKKTVMPDTTAIIFFLKAKGGWRDGQSPDTGRAVVTDKLRKEVEDFFDESKADSSR